ncbi:LOW QUALITY PROTEIN: inositol-tetrakisphosphate 1-kinase-like [Rhinophrynus dorsalis]
MPSLHRTKRIGLCLNDKKKRRLNFHCFEELCRSHGYEVIDIDLTRPLSSQGPFDLIIHKLSDLLVEAGQDLISHHLVQRLQVYLETHPHTILMDPLPALHMLLDRFQSYRLLRSLESNSQGVSAIFSPPCVELVTKHCDIGTAVRTSLNFPIICKTRLAHGPRSHQMSLIFNEEGLRDVTPPCVLQSFINHRATLYKVFVVGSQHFVVRRPSLRDFPMGETDQRTIFFNSHQVSKAESCSHLSEPLPNTEVLPPSDGVVNQVVQGLQEALGMSLFGVDLIVDTQTGRCAVIDVNAFPGYEGVSEFFPALLVHVKKILECNKEPLSTSPGPTEAQQPPAHTTEQSFGSLCRTDHLSVESRYKRNRTGSPYFALHTRAISADW